MIELANEYSENVLGREIVYDLIEVQNKGLHCRKASSRELKKATTTQDIEKLIVLSKNENHSIAWR